ncbi:MAG TPA: lysophospholipid acyltransferase family protein [Candidatus Limnocylindrales bacterium]|nr:lysophospholipid acyltransferase family protein [Candidatus Limnocylindrales bacterium]
MKEFPIKRYLKDFSLLLVYYPYRWLIQVLPFRIGYQIATLLGSIHYLFVPSKQKRKIIHNLDMVLGDKLNFQEKKAVVRGIYIHKQKAYTDLFIMAREDYKKYFDACSNEGISYLDQALAEGKGVVGVNFHFSSANLIATYLTYKGYKMSPILVLTGTKGASPWISQKILDLRSSIWKERGNFQIITSSKSLVSAVINQYRSLAENRVISAAGDGPLGKKFTLVNFFNVKLKAPLGPVLMAAKSGAPIVLSFVIRREDGTHHFVFKEPIKVQQEDEEVFKGIVQNYFTQLEYYVARYPDSWLYWTRMEKERVENGVPVIQLLLATGLTHIE